MGLDVNRLIVVAFAIASGFAGLAGILWAAQSGVVEPNMGFTPLLKAFVEMQYRRNDAAFERGTFRVRGDSIELFPAHYEDCAWRIGLFGDEVESIVEFDPLTPQLNMFVNVRVSTTLSALRGRVTCRCGMNCWPPPRFADSMTVTVEVAFV